MFFIICSQPASVSTNLEANSSKLQLHKNYFKQTSVAAWSDTQHCCQSTLDTWWDSQPLNTHLLWSPITLHLPNRGLFCVLLWMKPSYTRHLSVPSWQPMLNGPSCRCSSNRPLHGTTVFVPVYRHKREINLFAQRMSDSVMIDAPLWALWVLDLSSVGLLYYRPRTRLARG